MCVTEPRYNLVFLHFADSHNSVEWFTMASMPFGRHAVQKVRANMNLTSNATTNSSKRQKDNSMNHKFTTDQYSDESPSKYCDKMMNSIWGLYNRYSVHNLKSNTSSFQAQPSSMQQPATKESLDWLQAPINCPLDGMKFKLSPNKFHQ